MLQAFWPVQPAEYHGAAAGLGAWPGLTMQHCSLPMPALRVSCCTSRVLMGAFGACRGKRFLESGQVKSLGQGVQYYCTPPSKIRSNHHRRQSVKQSPLTITEKHLDLKAAPRDWDRRLPAPVVFCALCSLCHRLSAPSASFVTSLSFTLYG